MGIKIQIGLGFDIFAPYTKLFIYANLIHLIILTKGNFDKLYVLVVVFFIEYLSFVSNAHLLIGALFSDMHNSMRHILHAFHGNIVCQIFTKNQINTITY